MTNNTAYHIPVLLNECVEGLAIRPDGTYVDVTFGGGGHSKAIFDKLSPQGHLYAFDQDADAAKNSWDAKNFSFIASNFAFITNHLRAKGVKQVDGILADLGVSSHQFDSSERGFSIRMDARLDMRMNQSAQKSAEDVLNDYDENALALLFRNYGEIANSRKLAALIVRGRLSKRIRTSGEFIQLIDPCVPKLKQNKYLAQVFQAIRIEVNDELEALRLLLTQSSNLLKPGGRLVIMSYHSLEDRLVKNFMKRGSMEGKIEKDFFGNVLKDFTEVTRHPIVASEEEIASNKRARSAKLRIAERNG